MPLYQYQALSPTGKKFKATIDADSAQDAKLKLIRRQVAVLQLSELSKKDAQEKLSLSAVMNLTREIARLLQAGLPLFEALSALEEKYRGQKSHRLILTLSDQVKSGASFSQSMRAHPKVFDLLYVSMVSNAEKTGRLSETLLELAEWIAKQIEVRKQLMAALLYPALLSGFCLVVLSSLLFYVVPSLKELFNGRDLHPLTEIVFAVSAFACNSKSLLLALFSSLILIVAATFVSPQIHRKLAPISFKLPLLKPLLARVALIRFCRSAATLLEGGLPLTQAFSQARGVMRHPLLEEVVRQAEERISQGESIHAPFQNHPLIPPLIPRMMGIADEGGKLPFMMRQIAEIYEEDLEKTLTRFAALIQPLLLLALGLIIGLILLAVLLPLTDVSSFATG